eukprot:m.112831 g.112831  ORF g.112831 m.112831 type:complete len:1600 (+) comp16204_c0_seq1:123-4922(+)
MVTIPAWLAGLGAVFLALLLPSSHAATLDDFSVVIDNDGVSGAGMTLLLEFSGASVPAGLDYGALMLQEGWFSPEPVAVESTSVAGNRVNVTLDSFMHLTVPAEMQYTLNVTAAFSSSEPVTPTTATAKAFVVGQPLNIMDVWGTPDSVCSSLGGPVSSEIVVTQESELRLLASQRCTNVLGGLHIANLTLTDEAWLSALAGLREVHGSLVLSDNTGLKFQHFASLYVVAPASTILYQGEYGLYVVDNVDMDPTGLDLESFVSHVQTGKAHIADNAGFCLSEEQLTPTWWGEPDKLFLSFSTLSGCPSCHTLHDESGICVSQCQACPVYCPGGVVKTQGDLESYAQLNCTHIAGSLVLENLLQVEETLLTEALSTIRVIDDLLWVKDNRYIVGLESLSNLETVSEVFLENNLRLIDARLPSLQVGSTVTHSSNPRLCPDAHPYGAGPPCGTVSIGQTLNLGAVPASAVNTTLLANAIGLTLGEASVMVNQPTIDDDTGDTHAEFYINDPAPTSLARLQQISAGVKQSTFGSTVSSHYAVVPDVTPVGFTIRYPVVVGGYNMGISVVGEIEYDRVRLTWSGPVLGVNDSAPVYVVEYSAQLTDEELETLAQELIAQNIAPADDFQEALQLAQQAAEAVRQWNLIDAGSATTWNVDSCVKQGASDDCLEQGFGFDLRVGAYVGADKIISEIFAVSVTDTAMLVTDLVINYVEATGGFNATWEPPIRPPSLAQDNDIETYELQLRYESFGNGGQTFTDEEIASDFRNELRPIGIGGRVIVVSPTKAAELVPPFQDLIHNRTFTTLPPYTKLRVSVRAEAEKLRGLPRYYLVTTPEAVSTEAPQNLSLSSAASDSLDVNVIGPSVATGELTGFTFSWLDSHGESGSSFVAVTDAHDADHVYTLTVPDLLPYTTYTMRVAATTALGAGPTTSPVSMETLVGVPDAMPLPYVSPVSGNTHTVSWSAPSPLPGPIVRYEVIAGFVEGLDNGTLVYSGTARTATISLGDALTGTRIRFVTTDGTNEIFGEYSDAAYPSTASAASSGSGLVGGAAAGGAGFILIGVILLLMHRRRNNKRPSLSAVYVVPPPDEWEVEPEKVVMGQKLGEGAFGIVCKATVDGIADFTGKTQVAVKQCAGDMITDDDRNEFLAEADLMKKFAKPYHRNVLRLLGVVTQREPLMIITEIMANGDLKDFLRKHRPVGDRKALLSIDDLISMASDVAAGMVFLAEIKFVHRDLACRNCLVSEDLTVKISDFGMSRDVHYTDYYRKNGQALMPVRWMAPECLTEGIFTSETDVWSMGVVLWEMISFGALPYPGLSNQEVYEKIIEGYRMTQPPGCPNAVYRLMRRCWQSEQRITFPEIYDQIIEIRRMLSNGSSTYAELSCIVGGDLGDMSKSKLERTRSQAAQAASNEYMTGELVPEDRGLEGLPGESYDQVELSEKDKYQLAKELKRQNTMHYEEMATEKPQKDGKSAASEGPPQNDYSAMAMGDTEKPMKKKPQQAEESGPVLNAYSVMTVGGKVVGAESESETDAPLDLGGDESYSVVATGQVRHNPVTSAMAADEGEAAGHAVGRNLRREDTAVQLNPSYFEGTLGANPHSAEDPDEL